MIAYKRQVKMGKLEKIKNIEILRFLFTLVIVCCHTQHGVINKFYGQIPLYDNMRESFYYSWIPVEFFFIISGFFLFSTTNFSLTYPQFAKNKLIRLLPVVFVSLTLYFICSLFFHLGFSLKENLFTILNLQNIGLTFQNGNVPASWYVSSLFWGMSFYFYLNKCVDQKLFNLITACITLFCYSFWIHTSGMNFDNKAIVFNLGMIRALAGIGLGYFISMWFKENIDKIKKAVFNKFQILLCTFFEIYLFFTVFYYCCFHYTNYKNLMVFVIYFVGLFMLFLMKKGLLSKLLDNNFSVSIGKYSFSIFLTHQLIIALWSLTICEAQKEWVLANPALNIFVLFVIVILFGILIYHLFEKPITKYLKVKYCNK